MIDKDDEILKNEKSFNLFDRRTIYPFDVY